MIVTMIQPNLMPTRTCEYYQINRGNGKPRGSRNLYKGTRQLPHLFIDFQPRQDIIKVFKPSLFHRTACSVPQFEPYRVAPNGFSRGNNLRKPLADFLIAGLAECVNPA
jgi:hypothetical protein